MNGLNWAADGRGWFAVILTGFIRPEWQLNGSELVYIDLGGHTQMLHHSPGRTFAVPSPDGRHLAFVDYVLLSNAWMIER